jgi:hypothetical protein
VKCPPISAEFISWLDKVFPDRCPDSDVTDQQVRVTMGVQRVCRRLRKEFQEQSSNILSSE